MSRKKKLEIAFNDEAIKELHHKRSNGRYEYRFRKVQGLIPGVKLRYTPSKHKKVFTLEYWFNNRALQVDLGIFSDDFGCHQVQDLMSDILKKCRDNKTYKYLKDPKRVLDLKKIELPKAITLKEAIERIVKAGFPRKKVEGNLTKKTIQQYIRFFIGNNERLEKIKVKQGERGWGEINLDPKFKSWDEFWEAYPPGAKMIKTKENITSLYDCSLSDLPFREITNFELTQFLETVNMGYGSKRNFLSAVQCLYNFCLQKGLLGKPPPPMPTVGVELKQKEFAISPCSQHNNTIYDLDTLRAIDKYCIRHAKTDPFHVEALMFAIVVRLRIEEFRKLKWSDIQQDEEGNKFFVVPRYAVKGRARAGDQTEEHIVHITKPIQRVLDRIKRQLKRRGHAKYRKIPFIFPSTRSSYKKLTEPGEFVGYANSEDCQMSDVAIRCCFKRMKKDLGLTEGSTKTLRKTHITHANRILGGEHIARHYTGHKTAWVINKNYDKAKQVEIRKMSEKVSKIMFGR